MKTIEALHRYAGGQRVPLDIYDDPEKGREYPYWYGGRVVSIIDVKENETYELLANGEVWAKYYDAAGEATQ